MAFEWDEAKRLSNLRTHGLDFSSCGDLFDWRQRIDLRARFESEARILTVAFVEGTFVTLVWTWRGRNRRAISFRRARDGNDEHIVSYTAEQLRKMKSETDWERVRRLTDSDVEAAIASDPDEAGMDVDWSSATVALPARKASMTMRVDADVLAFFRASGRGWQTRVNAVLRSYMDHRQR